MTKDEARAFARAYDAFCLRRGRWTEVVNEAYNPRNSFVWMQLLPVVVGVTSDIECWTRMLEVAGITEDRIRRTSDLFVQLSEN